MKKVIVLLMVLLSVNLFASGKLSVITGKKGKANPYVKTPDVKVILNGDKVFYAERYLGEKGNYYLFLRDGTKVMLPKSMVKEIKLNIRLKEKAEKKPEKKVVRKPEKQHKKKLILTDYNIEREYFPSENENPAEPKEEKKSSGLRVKVENQVIERKKDTITFKADIKNITGLEIGKLSIILNIYDNKGKLVETKKVFLANSLKDGKSVPFTYSLKDPEGKIARFDYSFEGIVYKPVKKEE